VPVGRVKRRARFCCQFRARAAQILSSDASPERGHVRGRLEKLVRGMPKRLQQLRKNKFGRCGK